VHLSFFNGLNGRETHPERKSQLQSALGARVPLVETVAAVCAKQEQIRVDYRAILDLHATNNDIVEISLRVNVEPIMAILFQAEDGAEGN
jgi:hypothetical protein